MNEVIRYNGRNYYIYPGKKYFYNSHNFLHRQIWIDVNGEIPKEHYIHHIDGDRLNNDIDNLECVHKTKHGRDHYNNRVPIKKVCDSCGETFESKQYRKADRFCSNKCKSQWRRDNGVDDIEKICEVCGKEYKSNKYSKSRSCSFACRGKIFSTNYGINYKH